MGPAEAYETLETMGEHPRARSGAGANNGATSGEYSGLQDIPSYSTINPRGTGAAAGS